MASNPNRRPYNEGVINLSLANGLTLPNARPAQPGSNGTRPPHPALLRRVVRRILGHFQRTLAAGILVMLPIGITALVLKFIFDLLTPILQPVTDLLPGPDVHGTGLVALLLLIYLVGLVAAFVIGRRILGFAHSAMEVIPVVKGIYSTTRSAVELLSSTGRTNGTTEAERFSGVVLVEFPRPGIRSIGLITSQMYDAEGQEVLSVYVPTTPIPSSGFLVIVPSSQATHLDMSVDEAMSVIVSGGILSERMFIRSGFEARSREDSNE